MKKVFSAPLFCVTSHLRGHCLVLNCVSNISHSKTGHLGGRGKWHSGTGHLGGRGKWHSGTGHLGRRGKWHSGTGHLEGRSRWKDLKNFVRKIWNNQKNKKHVCMLLNVKKCVGILKEIVNTKTFSQKLTDKTILNLHVNGSLFYPLLAPSPPPPLRLPPPPPPPFPGDPAILTKSSLPSSGKSPDTAYEYQVQLPWIVFHNN